MILTGIGDEAGELLDSQIRAVRELGWAHLELRTVGVPGFAAANAHDLPGAAFDIAARQLEDSGISVCCFGSTIMNWACRVSDPFEMTLDAVRRTIPRLKRTRTQLVRIMSFRPDEEDYRIPGEVLRRVRDVTNMFLDEGLQPLHENCMNHGGMSWQHALELMDKCPGLKWVFDTGNPLVNPDRSKAKPWPTQDPWEFWEHVRDHVLHIHVKDLKAEPAGGTVEAAAKPVYTWPGEGAAKVQAILADARARGYSGAISIEPHMVAVFHEPGTEKPADTAKTKNFIEYGRVLQTLMA